MQTKIRNAVVYLFLLSAFSLAAQQLVRYGYLFAMPPGDRSAELNVNFSPRLHPEQGGLDRPGSRNSWAQFAMYGAARSGNREQIQALLDKGWDLKDSHGEAALRGAIDANRTDTLIYLLDKGADINGRDYQLDATPLGWAVYSDRFEMFKLLLSKGADPKVSAFHQFSLLSFASARGRQRYVRLLLQQDAGAPSSVSATSQSGVDAPVGGVTDLMEASLAGKIDTAQRLLDAGANVNAVTRDGWTPLMYAALAKNLDVVRLLVDKGAEINAATTNSDTSFATFTAHKGWTPLIFAIQETPSDTVAEYGLPKRDGADVVEFLLGKGADINARTEHGKTALSHAIDMERPNLVKLLVERGADVNAVDQEISLAQNGPILSIAASKGMGDTVNYLIEHGAKDVNSAFLSAVSAEHFDIASALLERGADVNAASETREEVRTGGRGLLTGRGKGETALMTAVIMNKPNTVDFLLTHGANPAIVDDNGNVAADYEKSYTSNRIVSMLRVAVPRKSPGGVSNGTPMPKETLTTLAQARTINLQSSLDSVHFDVPLTYFFRSYSSKDGGWSSVPEAQIAGTERPTVDFITVISLMPDLAPMNKENLADFETPGWGKKVVASLGHRRSWDYFLEHTLQRDYERRPDSPNNPGMAHYYQVSGRHDLYLNHTLAADDFTMIDCPDQTFYHYRSPSCKVQTSYRPAPGLAASQHLGNAAFYLEYDFSMRYLSQWRDIDKGVKSLFDQFIRNTELRRPPHS